MKKSEVLKRLIDSGIVAVVRAEDAEEAMKICEACRKAGIVGIELTFTVPGAVDVIKELANKYTSEEIIVGAGTVLDSETARAAILAGANYIVSPCLDLETIKLCNRYQIACMPGAMTIKEVVECMEAGADIVKVFPGNLFGPAMIKAIKGPLPQAMLMPTGGVNADNCAEWIRAGCVAVGAGGDLTAGAKTGDYDKITEVGKKMIEAIAAARMK
ncbi:bifunctional 2-keto-4-hydroxyglutarate aldolase/2-keto-3-deoxy-6-phosphogluconate aldolase [Christensenella timonensis]|uniref:bifunctional 2-keto-4-hydroxyglutarate aldolase/2-keto-3-deoxy-6-phosphogluconate aldolase n=1 Tax=Christensenella timonensis TaxID=1816678 RepID=UPI000835C9CB|nr:bifunctional 2-keto-4-hydroxyglutarate aldolase/2-keto-3-deoxy-6-phosphogluconate aldolase [Christensenella timonensis]